MFCIIILSLYLSSLIIHAQRLTITIASLALEQVSDCPMPVRLSCGVWVKSIDNIQQNILMRRINEFNGYTGNVPFFPAGIPTILCIDPVWCRLWNTVEISFVWYSQWVDMSFSEERETAVTLREHNSEEDRNISSCFRTPGSENSVSQLFWYPLSPVVPSRHKAIHRLNPICFDCTETI